MNKFQLTTLILFFSLTLMGQEKASYDRNELHLNAVYLLVGIPEIGYEYILNEESSLGIDLLFRIEDDIDPIFAATPYYRVFFGKKPAAGFFIEGFGMLNTTESYEVYNYGFDVVEDTVNETDFALGISVGGKFMTKSQFVFEVFGGVGRNLFDSSDVAAVPRFGLTVGKRF